MPYKVGFKLDDGRTLWLTKTYSSKTYADKAAKRERALLKADGVKIKSATIKETGVTLATRSTEPGKTSKVPSGKASSETHIKPWYCAKYPTDGMGQDINPKATFKGAMDVLKHTDTTSDFYDYVDAHDSVVRERIFDELARRNKVPYDTIYDMWMGWTPAKPIAVKKPAAKKNATKIGKGTTDIVQLTKKALSDAGLNYEEVYADFNGNPDKPTISWKRNTSWIEVNYSPLIKDAPVSVLKDITRTFAEQVAGRHKDFAAETKKWIAANRYKRAKDDGISPKAYAAAEDAIKNAGKKAAATIAMMPPVSTVKNPSGGKLTIKGNLYDRNIYSDILKNARKYFKDAVVVVCYNQADLWATRKAALSFYTEGMYSCEGSERDRYTNVVLNLNNGWNVALDE